jgi:elongation factor Ts
MAVSVSDVKILREKTGLGIMSCKKALEEAEGDMEKAMAILRKKGLEFAEKRKDRETAQGQVGAYIHMNGKIGTLVELNCETDFVAKNEEFSSFVKDMSMQVAATNPIALARNNVPEEVIDEKKKEFEAEIDDEDPEKVEKYIENKLNLFFEEKCLLEQPYLRDETITVEQVLKDLIAKTGENISIRRFIRFQLGGQ